MINQQFLQSLAMMESVAATSEEKEAINSVRGRYVGMYGTDNEYVSLLGRLESVTKNQADKESINEVRGRYALMNLTQGEVAKQVALECINGSRKSLVESDTYRDKLRYLQKENRHAASEESWNAFQNGEPDLEKNNTEVDKLPEDQDPDAVYPNASGLNGSGLYGKYLGYDVHHDGNLGMDHKRNPRLKDASAKAKFNRDIMDFEKNAEATEYQPEGGYDEGESDVDAFNRLDSFNDAESDYIMQENNEDDQQDDIVNDIDQLVDAANAEPTDDLTTPLVFDAP